MLNIKKKENLAKYSTYGIGGPAKELVEVFSQQELVRAIKHAVSSGMPYKLIGNGSNILFSDKGYKGLIIKNKIKELEFFKDAKGQTMVKAGSGMQLQKLIVQLLAESYVGMHWFSYIPATVGGAVYMNAKYSDHSIADFFVKGAVLTDKLTSKNYLKRDFAFSYDHSRLQDNKEYLLSAVFRLEKGRPDLARTQMKEIARKRAIYSFRSAGCVWRNLEPNKAKKQGLPSHAVSYLVDKVLGLKGKQIGDARISRQHAAFIENIGKAKAEDVKALIDLVGQEASQKLGVKLDLEIELVGFD